MRKETQEQLAAELRAMIETVIAEMAVNPEFATKIARVFAQPSQGTAQPETHQKPLAQAMKRVQEASTARLNESVFDCLEVHLEAALLKGHENEVRAFLGKLDRSQLQEVVRVQRLPGARGLLKAISEAENLETVVDAMVNGAAEKVRGRYFAAT